MSQAVAEKPKKPRQHDDYTVDRALHAVAECSGNTAAAARMLEHEQISVDQSTLSRWVNHQHADRYATIRAQVAPAIRQRAAEDHMALADLHMQAERKGAQRMVEAIDELEPRDLPGAIRNSAVASAIHREKALLLSDQPTQRVAVDVTLQIKELRRMGVDMGIEEVEGEAEEIEAEDVPSA